MLQNALGEPDWVGTLLLLVAWASGFKLLSVLLTQWDNLIAEARWRLEQLRWREPPPEREMCLISYEEFEDEHGQPCYDFTWADPAGSEPHHLIYPRSRCILRTDMDEGHLRLTRLLNVPYLYCLFRPPSD